MIEDYSEITSNLHGKIVKLSDSLSRRKWLKAHGQVLDIARDMIKLAGWLLTKHEED